MSKYPHRGLRATVAAAGMAALSVSFAGTAAAATPQADLPDHPDAPDASALDHQAPELPNVSDALSGHSPLVDNELVTFELPRLDMGSAGPTVPVHTVSHVSKHDSDGADPSDCYGLGGTHALPFGNKLDLGCHQEGNSVAGSGDAPVHTIAAHHSAYSGLVGHDPDAGDISQSDPRVPLVDDLPLHAPNLGQSNGYHVGTSQV